MATTVVACSVCLLSLHGYASLKTRPYSRPYSMPCLFTWIADGVGLALVLCPAIQVLRG